MKQVFFRRLSLAFFAWVIAFSASGQTGTDNAQKIKVYKSEVNPNATKDGIRGVSVVFSAEYLFSDVVFDGMRDGDGQVYFDYYLSFTDANNQPVYNPAAYTEYRKVNQTTAMHWAEEKVYDPKNKAQGRRSTGVELFVPYMALDMPSGTQSVKLSINAAHKKAGKFRDLHVQPLSINKPPVYFITLQPKQLSVTDKSGKAHEAQSLEQDIFIIPGTNKAAKDVLVAVNADTKQPVPFKYSAGDALRLKVEKSTSVGTVGTNKVQMLRAANGDNMINFDNRSAITGEWALDVNSAKSVNLKNEAVQLVLNVEKVSVPPVKLLDFTVNPHATHAGVAGASVTFAYDAKAGADMPKLVAMPTYRTPAGEIFSFRGGKVVAGNATVDTTGAVSLGGSGKVEVFYPAFNLLLNDPAIRQREPEAFNLQIRLQNHTSAIAQKEIGQKFPVSVVQDAKVAPAVRAKDTTFNNIPGLVITVPYEMPSLYFDLLNGEVAVQLLEPTSKETRAADLIQIMTLVNTPEVQKATHPAGRKGASFTVKKPVGAIRLFMPYTDLSREEKAPLPLSAKVVVNGKGSTAPVVVGENASSLRFELDNQTIKYVTVGISPIKMKKANTGNLAWRVSSQGRVLYQSPIIPADKTVSNLYTHSFYIHESDKIEVELLKGNDKASLKPMAKWEQPIKGMQGSGNVEMIPSTVLSGMDDGDTRSATLNYTRQ